MISLRTAALTLLALVAFAANSILCRLALKQGLVDPVAFTQVRLLSGALMLAPILAWRQRGSAKIAIASKSWRPAAALFAYAIAFSLAYVAMGAGAGALILFACVQITMIGIAMATGLRPGLLEWVGIALAFAGLVGLVAPGLYAPPWKSAALMAVAGIAWGIYTTLGKREGDAVAATARNFILAVPFALALLLAGPKWSGASAQGLLLAATSGAITSALGYVVWYAALRGLGTMQASIIQVASPVLVALGGILFLGETFTPRLVIAMFAILGGIVLTVWAGAARTRGRAPGQAAGVAAADPRRMSK
ncbi:MAG: DMT family transporter [Alphaproteobacteria bacterium]